MSYQFEKLCRLQLLARLETLQGEVNELKAKQALYHMEDICKECERMDRILTTLNLIQISYKDEFKKV
jgi:hypothetical protein